MDLMGDQDRRMVRAILVALAIAAAVIAPVLGSIFLPGCAADRSQVQGVPPGR